MFWGMPRVIVIACNVYEFMGPHWNELLLLKLLITLFLLKIPSPFFIGKKRIEARVQNLVFQYCFPSAVNLSTIATIVLMATPALRSYFELIKCDFTLCKNL